MALTLQDIDQLFRERGHMPYGTSQITQLQHALQTATRAQEAGASPALVTASLLHDLGHVIALHPTPVIDGVDCKHQYFVLPFLRGLFGQDVLEPIRLHVEAKRYLCFVEPSYAPGLSVDAWRSVALEGGSFDAAQAMEFAAIPWAPDAIKLRRWDDLAREAQAATAPLSHFLDIAAAVVRRSDAVKLPRLGSKPREARFPAIP